MNAITRNEGRGHEIGYTPGAPGQGAAVGTPTMTPPTARLPKTPLNLRDSFSFSPEDAANCEFVELMSFDELWDFVTGIVIRGAEEMHTDSTQAIVITRHAPTELLDALANTDHVVLCALGDDLVAAAEAAADAIEASEALAGGSVR